MIRVTTTTNSSDDAELSTFTILSYNCLSSSAEKPKMFPRTDPKYLKFDYRSKLLEQEFRQFNADIVCLQEIVVNDFHKWFTPTMLLLGYAEGLFTKCEEAEDGEAIFFKKDKFSLVKHRSIDYNARAKQVSSSLCDKNSSIVCVFEIIGNPQKQQLCVVNMHLSHLYEQPEVQLFQLKMLMAEVETMASSLPLVFAGDTNSFLLSAPTDYIRDGCISKSSRFFKRLLSAFTPVFNDDVQKATEYLTEKHRYSDEKLLPAYSNQTFELIFTVYCAPLFGTTPDRIWFQQDRLRVIELLDPLMKDAGQTSLRNFTLPNAEHPSDHLPIMARLQLLNAD